MQLRVPNQYKPTFFENLLSVFLPIPTRRVLSDKKIEKNKKINLSLTQHQKNKSSKKLTVSSSFQLKTTPSANKRKNNRQKGTRDQTCSTLQHESRGNHSKGLNFHPRKINFHHEMLNRPKIKSKTIYALDQIQALKATNQVPKYKTNPQRVQRSYAHIHKINGKQTPSFFGQYHQQKMHQNQICKDQFIRNLGSSQPISQCRNEKIQKIIQSLQSLKLKQKTNDHNSMDNRKQQSFILCQKIFKPRQKSSLIQLPKRQSYLHIYQSDQQDKLQNQSKLITEAGLQIQKDKQLQDIIPNKMNLEQQKIKQIDKELDVPQISVKEGKQKQNINSTSQLGQVSEPKDEGRENPYFNSQQREIKQYVRNIFEQFPTVLSKGDSSSLRSQSDCYSNVIQRMNGQNFITNQMDGVSVPRQWDQIRRKSLNQRLIQKFEQKQLQQQQVSKSQIGNTKTMDFKKKNFSPFQDQYQLISHHKCEYKEPETDLFMQSENLRNIQQMFITNDSNKFGSISQNVTAQIDTKTTQTKNIYQQFTKVNYLGVGRFASVYLCHSSLINFIFAMKQILKFTVKCNQMQDQLQKQITIQRQCNHPNIISLYYAWSDEKKYYLALQYGQQTLLNKIQNSYNNSCLQSQYVKHIYEICKGLQYLHQRNIIHRDIKPENIILVNGVCKIADFGWSSYVCEQNLNQMCGTPCYISPQIQNNQIYTTKSDCWSLGILAYELINGKLDQRYFEGGSLDRDALSYRHNVSQSYKQLVYKLLAKQQNERPSINQILTLQIFQNF